MATQEERPHVVIVAVREWWNPAGHLMSTARAFDPVSGLVAWADVDGHGRAAVIHAVRRQFAGFTGAHALPDSARFVLDVTRVGRRADLHTDPATVRMERVSPFGGVA